MSASYAQLVDQPDRTYALAADQPIQTAQEDVLGRGPLVKLLAAEVMATPAGHGLVMGVTGPWGIGKTSVLRLVEQELGQSAVVLHFNPWLFSGAEQLVLRFFSELGNELRRKNDKRLRQLGEHLDRYGEAVSPIGTLVFGRLWSLVAVARGVRTARSSSPTSARNERDKLVETLKELDRRIVVVIDDIDRLRREEIREVMRLVKLVGDLPNVTYMMAFAADRVINALEEDGVEDGRAYLEKIVQTAHELPPVPAARIRRLALQDLSRALGDVEAPAFDERAWANLYWGGIVDFLATVRDARRYTNRAVAATTLLQGEVALQDILALSAVAVFEPEVHARLKDITDILTGSGGIDLRDRSRIDQEHRERITAVLESSRNRAALEALLTRLFPAAGHLFGGSRYAANDRTWRAQRRVADPGVLKFYLHATLADEQVPSVVVGTLLGALARPEELPALLRSVDDGAVMDLLDRLRDYKSEFPSDLETAVGAAAAFMELEARLPESREMFAMPPDWALHFLVADLLTALPDNTREDAATALFERSPDLSGRHRVLQWFATRPDAEDGRLEPLLGKSATDQLDADLQRRIEAADPAQLVRERRFLSLMSELHNQDPHKAVDRAQQWSQDHGFMLALLEGATTRVLSSHGDEVVARERIKLNWDTLTRFLGDEVARERVSQLAADASSLGLTSDQQRLVDVAENHLREGPHLDDLH